MNLKIELTENELRQIIYDDFKKKLGDLSFEESDIKIEVKSKQNWNSEWESASFRATIDKNY